MVLRLFLLAFVCFATPALAFVRTISSTGRPLYWSNPGQALRGNPLNISGLSEAQVAAEFGAAFSSWSVAGTRASLSYSQSTSNPASGGNDGVNAVYFASAANRQLEWGVVAVTEVLYWVSSGQVAEADIVFNDNQFRFTAVEGDTGQSIGGKTAIYLRDVATHEAGHALGLDHSIVNLSTMIYTAFSGQFRSGGDDHNGVRSAYPAGGTASGSLSGRVAGSQGGIFGAHVQAVNLSTGKVEAGALAASDGSFRLGEVPAGKYAVLMEPFGADISSVSSYWRNVDHRFCGGSRYRRRFYSACGTQGLASVVEVHSGGNTSIGTLSPSCSQMGNPGGAPVSAALARELPNSGGAAFGTLRTSDAHYYRVRNVAGALTARALSYSLYSPVDVKVEILDSSGNAVPGATSVDNVEAPMPGGKTNFDSLATAIVATGDYLIKVTAAANRIPSSQFAAGWELLDWDGHYLLALGVDGDFGPAALTDMSACATVRNVAQTATFKDAPPIRKNADDRAAGCGTISSGGGSPWSGGISQVLLTALALQLLALALRLRRSAILARKRR